MYVYLHVECEPLRLGPLCCQRTVGHGVWTKGIVDGRRASLARGVACGPEGTWQIVECSAGCRHDPYTQAVIAPRVDSEDNRQSSKLCLIDGGGYQLAYRQYVQERQHSDDDEYWGNRCNISIQV